MQDDLLTQLRKAATDEEKACLLALSLVEDSPELREAALAAAVPHWFNAAILAALLETHPLPLPGGEEAGQSGESSEIPLLGGARGGSCDWQQTYQRLQTLPFTQPFGERGHALHDLTRAGLRRHLLRNEPEQFTAYSLRAAQYFLQAEEDAQHKVEGIYHLLAENTWENRTAFWDQMEEYCKRSPNLSAANMLLANLLELMEAGVLTGNNVERLLSVGYGMLGALQQNRGSVSAADDSYRKALPIFERLAQADPANAEAQRDLSVSYNKLGDLAQQQGDLNAAQQRYQQSLAIRERLAQADPANAEAQRDLSISYEKLGDLARQQGDLNAAQQRYQQSLAISERLAQADPANAEARRDLSVSYNKLGRIEELCEHPAAAIRFQEQALAIVQTVLEKDDQNAEIRNDVADCQGVLVRLKGDLEFSQGKFQTALELYQQALALSQQVFSEQPTNLDARRDVYWNYHKIGQACTALGQPEQAQEAYQSALNLLEPLAANPLDILAQQDLTCIRKAAKECRT